MSTVSTSRCVSTTTRVAASPTALSTSTRTAPRSSQVPPIPAALSSAASPLASLASVTRPTTPTAALAQMIRQPPARRLASSTTPTSVRSPCVSADCSRHLSLMRTMLCRGQLSQFVCLRIRRVLGHCDLGLRVQPPCGLHSHLLPVMWSYTPVAASLVVYSPFRPGENASSFDVVDAWRITW